MENVLHRSILQFVSAVFRLMKGKPDKLYHVRDMSEIDILNYTWAGTNVRPHTLELMVQATTHVAMMA